VDTRAARGIIERALTKTRNRTAYWLDLGNNAASGQFVLGQPLNARNRRKAARLRTVSELYPEIIDAAVGEDPLPSCSQSRRWTSGAFHQPDLGFERTGHACSALPLWKAHASRRILQCAKWIHEPVARRSPAMVEDAETRSAAVIPKSTSTRR